MLYYITIVSYFWNLTYCLLLFRYQIKAVIDIKTGLFILRYIYLFC